MPARAKPSAAKAAKSPKRKGGGTTPRRRSPRLAKNSGTPAPTTGERPGGSAAHAEAPLHGPPPLEGRRAAADATPDEPNRVDDRQAPVSSQDQGLERQAGAGAGHEEKRVRAPSSPRSGHRRRLLAVLLVVAVCGCLVGLVSGADALPKWPVREQPSRDTPSAPLQKGVRSALSHATAQAATGARLLVQRAQAALSRLSAPLRFPAPALCLAGAAALAALLERVHAPAWLSWATGISLLLLASLLAHGGGGDGTTAPPRPALVGFLAPSTLHNLLGAGPSSAVVGSWVDSWRASAADATSFTAAKMVLHTVSGAPGKTEEALLQASRGLVPPGSVLELTAHGCVRDASRTRPLEGSGAPPVSSCARRLAQHLSRASASGSPALVIVRGVESITDDFSFDALLSPLERLVDPSLRQPILGSEGPVRATVAAFVLVASHLSVERCEELRLLRPVQLQAELAGALEALLPASSFSVDVNIAKRALLNRLGASSGAVLCESPD